MVSTSGYRARYHSASKYRHAPTRRATARTSRISRPNSTVLVVVLLTSTHPVQPIDRTPCRATTSCVRHRTATACPTHNYPFPRSGRGTPAFALATQDEVHQRVLPRLRHVWIRRQVMPGIEARRRIQPLDCATEQVMNLRRHALRDHGSVLTRVPGGVEPAASRDQLHARADVWPPWRRLSGQQGTRPAQRRSRLPAGAVQDRSHLLVHARKLRDEKGLLLFILPRVLLMFRRLPLEFLLEPALTLGRRGFRLARGSQGLARRVPCIDVEAGEFHQLMRLLGDARLRCLPVRARPGQRRAHFIECRAHPAEFILQGQLLPLQVEGLRGKRLDPGLLLACRPPRLAKRLARLFQFLAQRMPLRLQIPGTDGQPLDLGALLRGPLFRLGQRNSQPPGFILERLLLLLQLPLADGEARDLDSLLRHPFLGLAEQAAQALEFGFHGLVAVLELALVLHEPRDLVSPTF